MKKNIYTKLIWTGIVIFLAVPGVIFWVLFSEKQSSSRLVSVSATFYPMAFLAEQIGGSLVDVKTVVPPGTEPHDFDPSLRDVADMYRSKIVIVSGAGIDSWAEKLEGDFSKKGVRVLVLSRVVDLIDASGVDHAQDPHFWLDPTEYAKSAALVLQALIDIDSAHADAYRRNFKHLEKKLLSMGSRFDALSRKKCRMNTVVVSHNAFSYLAKRSGFQVWSLVGIDSEQEASAGDLADTIRFMKENNIHFILDEPLGRKDMIALIEREANAEMLVLDPIEGILQSKLSRGENYFTVMDENWITLKKALECE